MGIETEQAIKNETPAAAEVDPFANSALDISGLTLSGLQVSALPDCCIPGKQDGARQGQERSQEAAERSVIAVEVTDKEIESNSFLGNLPEGGFVDPFAASALIIDGNSDLTAAIAAVPDCCKNPLDSNPVSNPNDINSMEFQKVEVQVSDKPIEQIIQNPIQENAVVGDPFSQAALNIDSSINIAEIAAVPDCCKDPSVNNNPGEVNQANAQKVEVQISDKPIENSKENSTQVNSAANDPFATAALTIDGVSNTAVISTLPDCCKDPKPESTNLNKAADQNQIQVELSDKPIDSTSLQSTPSNQQSELSIQKTEDSLRQSNNKDQENTPETTKADVEHLAAKNAQDLTILSRVITSNNSQDLANTAVERLLVASLEQNAQIHSQDSSAIYTSTEFRLTRIIAHRVAETPEVLKKPEIIVRELQDLVRAMNESRISRNSEDHAYNQARKVEQAVVTDNKVRYRSKDLTSVEPNKLANRNSTARSKTFSASGLTTRSTSRNINQRKVSGAGVQQVKLNNNGKRVVLTTKAEQSLREKLSISKSKGLKNTRINLKSGQNQKNVNSSKAVKNSQKTKLTTVRSTRLDKRVDKLKNQSTSLRLQIKRRLKLVRESRLNNRITKPKKIKLASTRQLKIIKANNFILERRMKIRRLSKNKKIQIRNTKKINIKDNKRQKSANPKVTKLARDITSSRIRTVTKLRRGANRLLHVASKLIRKQLNLVNLKKNITSKKIDNILNKKVYIKIIKLTKFVKQIKNLYHRVKVSLYKSIKPKLLLYSNKITNNIYIKNLIKILSRLLQFLRNFLRLYNPLTSFEQFLNSLRMKRRLRKTFEDEFVIKQTIGSHKHKLSKCNLENTKYEEEFLLDSTYIAAKHIALTMFVLMYKEKLVVKQGRHI